MADNNTTSPIQISVTQNHGVADELSKLVEELKVRLDPIITKSKSEATELLSKGESVVFKSEHLVSLDSLKDKLSQVKTEVKRLLSKIEL